MLKMRGININGELHTGTDLDLLFKGFEDEMPQPKTLTEDIPGADGITDYTEHAGLLPKYGNRLVTFHFFATGSKREIAAKFERLSAYHGQIVNVFHADDPAFYYRGRANLIKGETGVRWAYFDLTVDAFPYKLKKNVTRLNFSFEAESNFVINNNVMPVKAAVKAVSVTDPNPTDSAVYGIKLSCGGKSDKREALQKAIEEDCGVSGNQIIWIKEQE